MCPICEPGQGRPEVTGAVKRARRTDRPSWLSLQGGANWAEGQKNPAAAAASSAQSTLFQTDPTNTGSPDVAHQLQIRSTPSPVGRSGEAQHQDLIYLFLYHTFVHSFTEESSWPVTTISFTRDF